MTPRQTVPERVSAWFQAYSVIRDELTPAQERPLKAISDGARVIAANDRTAALVAAMLGTSGIRPTTMGEEGEE